MGETVPNTAQTPSARILAEAMETFAVTDAQGRSITVKRLTALDKLRLFRAVGPLLAGNAPYFGMAMLAAAALDIDGVPVPAPASESAIETAVAQLGNAGISAISLALKPPLDAQADGAQAEQHAGN
jgi:hypothetical protein